MVIKDQIAKEPLVPNPQAVLEKIQMLPAERIAEIEDFVEFITAREQERSLTRAASWCRTVRTFSVASCVFV